MTMLTLAQQLDRSQWWPPERLRAAQFLQLGQLLDHAARHAPFWQAALAKAGHRPGQPLTEEAWRAIPVLARAQVQRERDRLRAREVPQFHGSIADVASSGSTGTPVESAVTQLAGLMNEAVVLREMLWHRRELGEKVAAIIVPSGRETVPESRTLPFWSHAISATFHTGPAVQFDPLRPVTEMADWLVREDPGYLVTFPTIARELVRETARRGLALPRLKAVLTYGEQLPDELRGLIASHWRVPLQDSYSTVEVGAIASQCPGHPHYHVAGEVVLVEILDRHGRPCAAGEIGRVVVTRLHNFAVPLIRYAVGDYAEAGAPCPCGRGLPVLRRILGRARNRLVLPSGGVTWPRVGDLAHEHDLPIRQFQVIQRTRTALEVRLVAARTLTAAEEDRVRALVNRGCGGGFAVAVSYHDTFARGPRGKFEDFISEVPDPGA